MPGASNQASMMFHALAGGRGFLRARGWVAIRKNPIRDCQGSATSRGPFNASSNHDLAVWWYGLDSSAAYSRMFVSTSMAPELPGVGPFDQINCLGDVRDIDLQPE